MKRVMLSVMLLSLLMAPFASAAAVLDFGTGAGGAGGAVIDLGGGDYSGSGIRIDALTVFGTAFDGVYNVDGSVACLSGVNGSCGSLDFNTALNTISVTGSVPSLLIPPTTLLSGSFLSYSFTPGTLSFFLASGPDVKDPALLASLGLNPATEFAYFGFQTSVDVPFNGCTVLSPCTALSTDIANTAVPEPGTLLLIGSGLTGLALRRRRRGRV